MVMWISIMLSEHTMEFVRQYIFGEITFKAITSDMRRHPTAFRWSVMGNSRWSIRDNFGSLRHSAREEVCSFLFAAREGVGDREAILESATEDAPKCRTADTLRAEAVLCDSIVASLEGESVSVSFVLWSYLLELVWVEARDYFGR